MKIFNYLGYFSTPPAIIINVGEWAGKITLNSVFTGIISLFVIVFWYWKIREQKLKVKKAEKELNNE